MASKRKSYTPSASNFNFRPPTESSKWETKGMKPLPEPLSVMDALIMMIVHVCRRILFVDTNVKVGLYALSLFLISFLADVLPFPKTYFANSDNIFNKYFVKLGWGWTLIGTVPFLVLTSYTYSCGKRNLVVQHVSRLGIATVMWFVFTNSFNLIEHYLGKCSVTKKDKYNTKEACLAAGYYWHSLDLSGHAFILVYSSLVIIEEARAIIGWEGIRDFIRNEEHSRSIKENDTSNPLRYLTHEELTNLKDSYIKFTPVIRLLFIGMAMLSILWDSMLLFTMLYFHIMVEKLISGLLAIAVWFLTYRVWYAIPKILPNLPGDGLFKYNRTKDKGKDIPIRHRGSIPTNTVKPGQLPTFMGMPLYGLRTPLPTQDGKDIKSEEDIDNKMDGEIFVIKSKASLNVNSSNSSGRFTGTPPLNSQTPRGSGPITRSQTLASTGQFSS